MSLRPAFMVVLAATVLALPTAASAQVLGTFSWQMQPYCNVVTLQVIQQGSLYQLLGTDDLCGAGPAPVTGTAVPTAGGAAFGMTAALPSGRPAHLSATISVANVSGTWSDADGHTGAFAFNATTGGSPRPAPVSAAAITAAQFAPTAYAGNGAAATVARSDHNHDVRYYTKAQSDAQAPEVISTSGNSGGYTFVADRDITASAESFTTTRAGHLLITKTASNVTINCTGASDPRILFLRVDGVALRSSVVHLNTAAFGSSRLVGVTDAAIAAGAHSVDVAWECQGASTAGTWAISTMSNAGIVVLP